MEFLRIGESKLKIVLNDEEANRYKLDCNTADCTGAQVRRAFWRILDMAKEEVGFDPGGDKVLIQLYPMSGGGCEIFVTKLGILPLPSARLISRSDRVAMLSKKQSFYVFDSPDDLIACALAVKRVCREVCPTSDVYFTEDKYYLAIDEYGKGGEPNEFPCILEFGRGLTAEVWAYISEHATRLTGGDGIDRFSSL